MTLCCRSGCEVRRRYVVIGFADFRCARLLAGFARPPSAREQRSAAVKREFQLTHPCPATGLTSGACPGWVKDHIVPLACGGPDAPSNMQWQTIRDARAKDKWEAKGCAR